MLYCEKHRMVLERFLALCPPQGRILDAACGTGKYWPIILDAGRSVFGIDQSQQMLLNARAKFPDVPTEKRGRQELEASQAFDGIICMEALENVSPEDWPLVLSNFHRALKPGDLLYLTVEIESGAAIRAAFLAGQQQGLPVVEGEWAHEGWYHYYPAIEQVRAWTQEALFAILEEAEGSRSLPRRHITATATT